MWDVLYFLPQSDCEREIEMEDELHKGVSNKGLVPLHMLSFKLSINAPPTMPSKLLLSHINSLQKPTTPSLLFSSFLPYHHHNPFPHFPMSPFTSILVSFQSKTLIKIFKQRPTLFAWLLLRLSNAQWGPYPSFNTPKTKQIINASNSTSPLTPQPYIYCSHLIIIKQLWLLINTQ